MKKAFVSCDVSQNIAQISKIEALPLLPYDSLDAPVCSHADMLVFIIGRKIFTYKDYYKKNPSVFETAKSDGYELCFVAKQCEREYPNDIALNVLTVGKTLFANSKHTAVEILEYAKKNGYDLVDVKQGYSACSTLVLSDKCLITADKSIYNAAKKASIDAVLINSGEILLEGYSCGFIGGASFVFENVVYFMGDIKKHSSYKKIKDKIDSLGMRISLISSGNVFDFGGIRLI